MIDRDHTNKRGSEKAMVHRRRFLKIYLLKFCDIWQNFSFYRTLNNEKFKMEVDKFRDTFNIIHSTIILMIN